MTLSSDLISQLGMQVSKLQPRRSGLLSNRMVSTTSDAWQETNGAPPTKPAHRVSYFRTDYLLDASMQLI